MQDQNKKNRKLFLFSVCVYFMCLFIYIVFLYVPCYFINIYSIFFLITIIITMQRNSI